MTSPVPVGHVCTLEHSYQDGDLWQCCGGKATQVDHVVPVALGGTDAVRNLAAACEPCNLEKGGRTPDQWKAWRLNRGRSWPPVRA